MINHMLFMDDLKIFAKNDNEVDSLLQTIRQLNVVLTLYWYGVWDIQVYSSDIEEGKKGGKSGH